MDPITPLRIMMFQRILLVLKEFVLRITCPIWLQMLWNHILLTNAPQYSLIRGRAVRRARKDSTMIFGGFPEVCNTSILVRKNSYRSLRPPFTSRARSEARRERTAKRADGEARGIKNSERRSPNTMPRTVSGSSYSFLGTLSHFVPSTSHIGRDTWNLENS